MILAVVKKNEIPKILVQDYVVKPIALHDIDNMIVTFDGSQHQNVAKWITDSEDIVSLFNLSDLHKLILAKRQMAGRAKLLMKSENKINIWLKFKASLISEFGQTCNSAELHELLSKRKTKDHVSLDEYFLIYEAIVF